MTKSEKIKGLNKKIKEGNALNSDSPALISVLEILERVKNRVENDLVYDKKTDSFIKK